KDRCLARRIDAGIRHSDVRVDGGIEHDGGAVGQKRQRFLNREIRALEVDVEDRVVKLLAYGFERRELADSRVDEEHVDAAEPGVDRSKQLVDLRQLRDV